MILILYLQIQVYTSTKGLGVNEKDLTLIWKNRTFDVHDTIEQ